MSHVPPASSQRKLIMWYKVQDLWSQGFNKSQISRHLCINRRTVRSYLSMDESSFLSSSRYQRMFSHKLDVYEDFVRRSLELHPYLSSSQIRDWLIERYSDFPQVDQKTVYNYVRHIRHKYHLPKSGEHHPRQYEKLPDSTYGEYAQVDFGERWMRDSSRHPIKVYFYVIVLCRSRYKYVYFSQVPFTTALTVYAHELSFSYFGGKPQKIIYDQDKVLLQKENLGDVLLTHGFQSFVNEQHFTPVFCRKGDPESKGKVENVVRYVKYNFLRGRTFHSIERLNSEALDWLQRTGNGREHSSTHRIPVEEFIHEQSSLHPYHGIPTPPSHHAMKEYHVRKDNTICYHSNYYSVPCGTYQGTNSTVWLHDSDGKLELYDKESGKLVACHTLSLERGRTIRNHSHQRVRNATMEELEKRIIDYAGDDGVATLWLSTLYRNKPCYYRDNLNHILRAMRTFSKSTFHKALEVCLDKGAYNALMLTQTATTIQKRKHEHPLPVIPSNPSLPPIASTMPEKTDINQYSRIFQ